MPLMPTFHLHLDESGDLNFSKQGTQYYVFTVAWTYYPLELANSLTALRFSLLKRGHDLARFHAADDKQENRDAVINEIVKHRRWRFTAIIIEKAKVDPSIYETQKFYPKYAGMVVRWVLRRRRIENTENVLLYVDNYPTNKHREALKKAIKYACVTELPSTTKFHLYHHYSHSNAWLQVTDYCCWAVFRKWERNDPRTYTQLSPYLAGRELDVLAKQTNVYY